MKILVVSDTHNNYTVLNTVIKKNPDADMLIHLGDGEREFVGASREFPQLPMVYVGGNCDFGAHKTTHVVNACGCKIFCCHGHTLGVREGTERLVNAAKQNGCVIALYGHTHIFRTETADGVFVMNPGSPALPRNCNKPTFGIIRLGSPDDIEMNIVALETE